MTAQPVAIKGRNLAAMVEAEPDREVCDFPVQWGEAKGEKATGTIAGANRHQRFGTPLCGECKEAKSQYRSTVTEDMEAVADAGGLGVGLADYESPEWTEYANCRGRNSDLFFNGNPRIAKGICFDCMVREECREWALVTRQPYGVWGGLTEEERRSERRRRIREARQAERERRAS